MPTKREAIFGPEDVIERVRGLRIIPEEPAWKVLVRLLDSYDLSHPKTAPRAAPESPSEVPA